MWGREIKLVFGHAYDILIVTMVPVEVRPLIADATNVSESEYLIIGHYSVIELLWLSVAASPSSCLQEVSSFRSYLVQCGMTVSNG